MFHWICPECGREIAPTIRECSVCDPVAATVETALVGGVEAPARAENDVAAPVMSVSLPLVETEPEPKPKPYEPIAPVVQTTLLAAPLDAAPPTLTVAAPVNAASPALAERIESASPLAARSSQSVPRRDAGDAEDGLLPQFGAPSGRGDPLDHLSSMLVSSMLDPMREPSAPEPPPSRDALPLPMRPAANVPASLRAFIAELQPAGAKLRLPSAPDRQRPPAPEPPLLTNPIPLPLRSSRQAPAPPLGAKLLTLPVEPREAVQPSTRPLDPAPALAPLGNYSPLAGHPLRPAIPRVELLKKECGPRTTLPGPMLTRRLVKFMDRELSPIRPAFLRVKKSLIPAWMATALILGTLLGAGFASVISVVRPAADAKPLVPAQTRTPAATAAATPASTSGGASPLANAIEVTGFRIQMNPAKKSEIEYLVVNHTPTRFSGVTVYVTLYAADVKAGQPPLCKFQFTAPNLAPFQAKDMTSAIERMSRPVTLPDWQDLRATVEIGE